VLAAYRAPRLAPIFEGLEAVSVEDMGTGQLKGILRQRFSANDAVTVGDEGSISRLSLAAGGVETRGKVVDMLDTDFVDGWAAGVGARAGLLESGAGVGGQDRGRRCLSSRISPLQRHHGSATLLTGVGKRILSIPAL
jgi:hypothetical protein